MKLVADAIYSMCDEKDGVKDGVITDPRRYGFEPSVHLKKCAGAETADGFTEGQIHSLDTQYSEQKINGQRVYPGWPVGAEIAGANGRPGRGISNLTPSRRVSARPKRRQFESNAARFLYDHYVWNDPERIAEYEHEVLNAEIARKIFGMRTKAGLSQRNLAKRVGTSASAICRLEDGDYEGHSLSLLKRIAEALERAGEDSICRRLAIIAPSSGKSPN